MKKIKVLSEKYAWASIVLLAAVDFTVIGFPMLGFVLFCILGYLFPEK